MILRKGNLPYIAQDAWVKARAFLQDVVIIKLGTNDSKPQNWRYKNEFAADYDSMIHTLQSLPSSKPVILLCSPLPAYNGNYGINDRIIQNLNHATH